MEVIQYPNSPFKLHQPFPPAGDQPTAIAGLLEGLSDGLAYQTLLGVTGSGKTYTMANVIASKRPPPPLSWRTTKPLPPNSTPKCASFSPKTRWNISCLIMTITSPKTYVPSRDLFIEKRQRDQ